MIAIVLALPALGGELRPVLDGDTVESIATSLGDAALAASIRGLNNLAEGQPLEVGTLLLLPPPAVVQVDQHASLVSVVREVTAALPGAPAAPAAVWDQVPAGATVCTGPNSYTTLQLASACEGRGEQVDEITLLADTCVEIQAVVASSLARSSVVKVLSGSVVVADPGPAGAGDPPSSVVIQAGTGLVTGEGGYRAHLEPDQALRTEALTQPVALLGGGAQRDLEAGQGARVPEGGTPTEPVQLIVAGTLIAPAHEAPLSRPAFAWKADPEAFGYQFSIAGDMRFTKMLYVEPTPEPGHLADLLFLPLTNIEGHWWRVATLDRFGFLGLPSEVRRFIVPAGVAP